VTGNVLHHRQDAAVQQPVGRRRPSIGDDIALGENDRSPIDSLAPGDDIEDRQRS
jgi:hypothetical protein